MAIADENTRIQVTISKELKRDLEKKAKQNNRSVSNYVTTLIKKDLYENKTKWKNHQNKLIFSLIQKKY